MRDDHRAHRRRRGLERDRPERDAGLRDLRADAQARLARVRHARAVVRGLPRAARATCSASAARASSSSWRSSTAAASRSRRWESGSRRAHTTSRSRTRRSASSSAGRSRSSRRCSSSSPTWRPRSRRGASSSTAPRGSRTRASRSRLAAAQAKLYTGMLSNRAANAALQIHGGYGFMDEYAISRLYRDQKILEIGEGTNEVQRMVIARLLGLYAMARRATPRGQRRPSCSRAAALAALLFAQGWLRLRRRGRADLASWTPRRALRRSGSRSCSPGSCRRSTRSARTTCSRCTCSSTC